MVPYVGSSSAVPLGRQQLSFSGTGPHSSTACHGIAITSPPFRASAAKLQLPSIADGFRHRIQSGGWLKASGPTRGGRPRRCFMCSAAASNASPLPQSREDAVQQAAKAMSVAVEAACGLRPGRKRKGKAQGGRRMLVELPDADTSPASTVQLVRELVERLFSAGEISELTVVFADFEAAREALKANFSIGVDVEYLEEAAESGLRGTNMLVVAPSDSEMASLAELMSKWSGQVALLLNPGWDPFTSLPAHSALQASFVPVYSFRPVEMKVGLTPLRALF
eukprot:CAMPEP_0117658528 /NCGR_PEP_ID=MMETSP0804-20121206/5909_1 /TAXON_ID=1074897 /ORGANISM="Tetraselmis astigmatica, Strain CCMP880" /LENGTH=279 /DNA_ID=CAMNT_0005465049 /DNA_START=86 /DNA_END=925 /DNA_ORIENTATION=-